MKLFASPEKAPRSRRATDVLLLVTTAVALWMVSAITDPPAGAEQALIDLIGHLPHFLDGLWQLAYDASLVWVVGLLLAAGLRRRATVVRDSLISGGFACLIVAATARVVSGEWPAVLDDLRAAGPPSTYPPMRLALCLAVIVTMSPHLSLPFRRVGRFVGLFASIAVAVLGVATPSGAVAGALAGAMAAALTHLIFGTSAGRLTFEQVESALRELEIDARTVGPMTRGTGGSDLVSAIDPHGTALDVKIFGRDAYDTQLVAKLWRSAWYRGDVSPPTLSRQQHAEHEAFVSLLAVHNGVPAPDVVTARQTADHDAVLVLRVPGVPLDTLPADTLTETMADDLWRVVGKLHDASIAHGQIDSTTVRVCPDGSIALGDFSAGVIGPDERHRQRDGAQVLAVTACAMGPDRAVQAALRAVGRDGIDALLPYVQSAAFGSRLRRALGAARLDPDDLRARAAELSGTKEPDLAPLRRVTWGGFLRTALLVVATGALISAFSGIDFAEVGEALSDATWSWIILGMVIAQLPRLTQVIATKGACPQDLPSGPVAMLQFAISYINLAVPSSAGRTLLNIRFFQRQGVPGASVVTIGAIDGFAGFTLEAILLVLILALTPASLDLNLQDPASDAGDVVVKLLVIVLIVAVVSIVTVVVVRRWRQAILGKVRETFGEVRGTFRVLRTPKKLGMLFTGNLLAEILFPLALGTVLLGFHEHVGLGTLIFINIVVSLFSGLLPIPGGIGVVEGGLTLGLVEAGVPEPVAFSAVIMYRLGSFYLPPIWGYFAFRWLENNKYI